MTIGSYKRQLAIGDVEIDTIHHRAYLVVVGSEERTGNRIEQYA